MTDPWTLEATYRQGVQDALTAALKALDGHSFSDTAHDRIKRLRACERCGHSPEEHDGSSGCLHRAFRVYCTCAEFQQKRLPTAPVAVSQEDDRTEVRFVGGPWHGQTTRVRRVIGPLFDVGHRIGGHYWLDSDSGNFPAYHWDGEWQAAADPRVAELAKGADERASTPGVPDDMAELERRRDHEYDEKCDCTLCVRVRIEDMG